MQVVSGYGINYQTQVSIVNPSVENAMNAISDYIVDKYQ